MSCWTMCRATLEGKAPTHTKPRRKATRQGVVSPARKYSDYRTTLNDTNTLIRMVWKKREVEWKNEFEFSKYIELHFISNHDPYSCIFYIVWQTIRSLPLLYFSNTTLQNEEFITNSRATRTPLKRRKHRMPSWPRFVKSSFPHLA